VFRVVDDSMRPTLEHGQLVVTRPSNEPRQGELRVFRHPTQPRWLIKRVGEVITSDLGYGTVFEALSDDPHAARAGDSREFGPVSAVNSYRVVWPRRTAKR
jgi:hypothetical protein